MLSRSSSWVIRSNSVQPMASQWRAPPHCTQDLSRQATLSASSTSNTGCTGRLWRCPIFFSMKIGSSVVMCLTRKRNSCSQTDPFCSLTSPMAKNNSGELLTSECLKLKLSVSLKTSVWSNSKPVKLPRCRILKSAAN